MTHRLLLIGHGKMGSVLLERWRNAELFAEIHVISPNHTQADNGNIHWHRDLNALPASVIPTVIVFAIKPAMMASLLPRYGARFASASPLYISVAAGKTLAFYQDYLGKHSHIVRAMPNTPALIGEGMTALCALPTLSAAARKTASDMMEAIGHILWIDDESQMDAVTAISGCGPAYVFLFIESLIQAGIASGLSAAQSRSLALQTVRGSQALAAQSNQPLADLCAQVASPGGATEAAIKVLKNGDALQSLVEKAVQSAIARSREMAG